MLSICARAARHLRLATSQLERNFASFTARDIYNERSDEAGTLIARFAKHIAIEGHKRAPLVPTTVRYADYFPVSDVRYFQKELQRTSHDQLAALIFFASTYRSNADPAKFAIILNDLDAAAVRQLSAMDADTVLRTLYALLFLIPNWIARTDFYTAATERLANDFKEEVSMEHFVQLCFYLGLDKRHAAQRTTQPLPGLLEQHLERNLEAMSTMDLAMVCSSAFKTSTKVQSKAYDDRLVQELKTLPLDGASDALLVTFIKSLRLQRVRSDEVCEHLAQLFKSETLRKQLQTRGLVHVFAYFAENLWDSEECLQPLIDEFMERLGESNQFHSYAETLRGKDLATFLWCCAQLSCTDMLGADQLQRLEVAVLTQLRNKAFQYHPDQLVDSCLSLWTLGQHSRQLLQESIIAKQQQSSNKHREQPKVDSRLTVLVSAAAIEQPAWKVKTSAAPFDLNADVHKSVLKARSDLVAYSQQLSEEVDVDEVKTICPINGINIPGLLVSFKDPEAPQVFVEMLSPEQTLRFSDEPVGLVRLKARLIAALGHKVVVLPQRDLLKEKYTSLKDLIFEGDNTDDQPKAEAVVSSS